MCLEFDVRWFPDQTCGLLNAAVVLLFMLILKSKWCEKKQQISLLENALVNQRYFFHSLIRKWICEHTVLHVRLKSKWHRRHVSVTRDTAETTHTGQLAPSPTPTRGPESISSVFVNNDEHSEVA